MARPRDAAQRVHAFLGKAQIRAHNQVLHSARHEHFAGSGKRADARPDVHRNAADVAVDEFTFAGVQSRTNFDAEILRRTPHSEQRAQGRRTSPRIRPLSS